MSTDGRRKLRLNAEKPNRLLKRKTLQLGLQHTKIFRMSMNSAQ